MLFNFGSFIEPEQMWTLAYDGDRQCECHNTNLSKNFNLVHKGASSLPERDLIPSTFHSGVINFFKNRRHGRSIDQALTTKAKSTTT